MSISTATGTLGLGSGDEKDEDEATEDEVSMDEAKDLVKDVKGDIKEQQIYSKAIIQHSVKILVYFPREGFIPHATPPLAPHPMSMSNVHATRVLLPISSYLIAHSFPFTLVQSYSDLYLLWLY